MPAQSAEAHCGRNQVRNGNNRYRELVP
jgi:hypothetical protein